ncbi:MAG: hypothetical protein HFG34_03105 [Eubacterium sp.]|nr:hypothetical protein [Eubacterium sp.]
MRFFRKKCLAVALCCAVCLTSANPQVVNAKSKVKRSKKYVTMKEGKTVKVTFKGVKGKVKWFVEGGRAVKVVSGKSKTVKIKAVRVGRSVVRGKYKKNSYRIFINVKKGKRVVNKNPANTPVPSVTDTPVVSEPQTTAP